MKRAIGLVLAVMMVVPAVTTAQELPPDLWCRFLLGTMDVLGSDSEVENPFEAVPDDEI